MRVKFTCYPKGYAHTPSGCIVDRTFWCVKKGPFKGIGDTKESALESLLNQINAKKIEKIEYWEDVDVS